MNEYIKKIIQNATFDDGIFAEKSAITAWKYRPL